MRRLFCWGQRLHIDQYQMLFVVIRDLYGRSNGFLFQLPDLRGYALIHRGQGPGLTPRDFGQIANTTGSVIITQKTMPSHSHLPATTYKSESPSPAGKLWGAPGHAIYTDSPKADTKLHAGALGTNGGGMPHNNRQPYLGLNYIIATEGEYPERSS